MLITRLGSLKLLLCGFLVLLLPTRGLADSPAAAAMAARAFAEIRLPKDYNSYRFECKTLMGPSSSGVVVMDSRALKVDLEVAEGTTSSRLILVSDESRCLVNLVNSRTIHLHPKRLKDCGYFTTEEYMVLPDRGWNLLSGRDMKDFLKGNANLPAATREEYDSTVDGLIVFRRYVESGHHLEIVFSKSLGVPLSYRVIEPDGKVITRQGKYEWIETATKGAMLVNIKELDGQVVFRELKISDASMSRERVLSVEEYLKSLPIGYQVRNMGKMEGKAYVVGGRNGIVTRRLLDLADTVRATRQSISR